MAKLVATMTAAAPTATATLTATPTRTPTATSTPTPLTTATPTPISWTTHRNVVGGFTFEYPAHWEIEKGTSVEGGTIVNYEEDDVVEKLLVGGFLEGMNNPTTLATFKKTGLDTIKGAWTEKENARLIWEKDDVTVRGLHGFQFEIVSQEKFSLLHDWTIVTGLYNDWGAWSITYAYSTKEEVDEMQAEAVDFANEVVSRFRPLPRPATPTPRPRPTVAPKPTTPPPPAASIGDHVSLRGWEMWVERVHREKTVYFYDSSYVANGVFAIIIFTVHNTGSGTRYFADDYMIALRDEKGNIAEDDSFKASSYAEWQFGGLDSTYTDVNPGVSRTLVVAFDIAEGTQTLELLTYDRDTRTFGPSINLGNFAGIAPYQP